MKIQILGKTYQVIIQKKRANRNTYLRVKEDLNLYVTTNFLMSDKKIQKLIEENMDSIVKMYQKQTIKNNLKECFFFLGKEYDSIFTNSNTITLGNDKVFIGKEVDLDKWYKKQAEILFKERLNACYQNYTRKIPYPSLKIRQMKSRWGVCNTKTKTITLNLELIKKEMMYLDYVIIHELSHLIEGNHSSKFWDLVEENCPGYKQIRKQMKTY